MGVCKRLLSLTAAASLLALTLLTVVPALAQDAQGQPESPGELPGVTGLSGTAALAKLEAETFGLGNLFESKTNTDGRYASDAGMEALYNKTAGIQTTAEIAAALDPAKTPYVQFILYAQQAKDYTIKLRTRYLSYGFAEGKAKNPRVNLLLNGNAPRVLEITSAPLGGRDDAMDVTLPLQKGRNVLRLTSMTKDYIDYIKDDQNVPASDANKTNYAFAYDYLLIPEGVSSPLKLEAETYGTPNHFAVKTSSNENRFSGNGMMEFSDNGKAQNIQTTDEIAAALDPAKTPYVQFVLYAQAAGDYTLGLRTRYVPYGIARNPEVNLLLNDDAPRVLEIATPAGGNRDRDPLEVTLSLKKGRNVLRLTSMTKAFIEHIQTNATENKTNFYFAYDYLQLPEGVSCPGPSGSPAGAVKVEAETFGARNHFSIDSNAGNYSGGQALQIYGNSSSKAGQIPSTEEIGAFLDRGAVPFVQFILYAQEAGTYDLGLRVRHISYDFPTDQARNPEVNLLLNDDAPRVLEITTPVGGNSSAAPLALSLALKKGRNVLRLTSMTADFIAYIGDHGTSNQSNFYFVYDYLQLPEGVSCLPPAEDTTVATDKLAAAKAAYYANMKKGSADDFWDLQKTYPQGVTPQTLTVRDLPLLSHFSLTLAAPADGYYSVTPILRYKAAAPVNLGVLVDGQIPATLPVLPPLVSGSDGADTMTDDAAEFTLYLTQGRHVITFTSLMSPEEAVPIKPTNFYRVVLRGGLRMEKEQTDPMDFDTDYTRFEAEEYADWPENKMKTNGRSEYSGGTAVELHNTAAVNQHQQSLEEIQRDGLDRYRTPGITYTIDAPADGDYTLYFGTRFVGFLPDKNPDILVILNDGAPQRVTLQGEKGGNSKPTRLSLHLKEGRNVLRFTHYTRAFVDEVLERAANAETSGETIENTNNLYLAHDYLDLPGTLTAVKTGVKDPAYQIIEAETHGMTNLMSRGSASHATLYSGGAGNGDCRMDYTQTTADIRANGLDAKKTPFTLYTVYAPEEGDYDVATRIRCGRYGPNVSEIYDLTAQIAVIANDDHAGMQVIGFPVLPERGDWTLTDTVTLHLKKGENKIRVTALTGDLLGAEDGKPVLWHDVNEAFLWIDQDYLAVPAGLSGNEPVGGRIEAENSLFSYYTHDLYSSAGGFVGLRDEGNTRNAVTHDITYDSLDIDSMSLVHMVHYKVIAPKDGLYEVTIALRAYDNYGASNIDYSKAVGFVAVMVNCEDKYKVEFLTGYKTIYTQLRLKEGLNTISVSGTLKEMLTASMEPVNVTMRIDQDYLDLGPGLTAYDEGRLNPGDDDVSTPLIETTRGPHSGGSTQTTTPPSSPSGGTGGDSDPGDSAATGAASALPLGLGLAGASGAAAVCAKRRKKPTDS